MFTSGRILLVTSGERHSSSRRRNTSGCVKSGRWQWNYWSLAFRVVTVESSDAKIETPAQEDDEETSVVDNNEEEPAADEESDNDEEPEGPLTAVESTCMLSDMVSKLTLIHETSCRPLPFVDERVAQQFLTCNPTAATTSSEAEDIKTLEHCFQRYFKIETLSGENSFDCYYCRSQNPGQSKLNVSFTSGRSSLQSDRHGTHL